MKRMRRYVVVLGMFCLFSCEGSHTSLGPEKGTENKEGDSEETTENDGGVNDLTVAESCDEESGVTVKGELLFDGDIPSGAALWVWFTSPDGGIPPCSQEIASVKFPASFVFTNVPSDRSWSLEAMLDVDGGFPPLPVVGDYVGEVSADDLDLSTDVEGISISLTLNEK